MLRGTHFWRTLGSARLGTSPIIGLERSDRFELGSDGACSFRDLFRIVEQGGGASFRASRFLLEEGPWQKKRPAACSEAVRLAAMQRRLRSWRLG